MTYPFHFSGTADELQEQIRDWISHFTGYMITCASLDQILVESSFVRYFFICSLSSLTGILGCLDLFDTDWDSGLNRDDTIYLLSLSCWYSIATRETLIT